MTGAPVQKQAEIDLTAAWFSSQDDLGLSSEVQHHQLNMTLIAPVLVAAAAVSNPFSMSASENPNL